MSSEFSIDMESLQAHVVAYLRQRFRIDTHDAEDVSQEVCVTLLETPAEDLEKKHSLVSWAIGIAKYKLMESRRTRTRRRQLLERYNAMVSTEDMRVFKSSLSESTCHSRSDISIDYDSFKESELSENEQEILDLWLAGNSVRSIADSTNIDKSTVHRRIQSTIEKVTRFLNARGYANE